MLSGAPSEFLISCLPKSLCQHAQPRRALDLRELRLRPGGGCRRVGARRLNRGSGAARAAALLELRGEAKRRASRLARASGAWQGNMTGISSRPLKKSLALKISM